MFGRFTWFEFDPELSRGDLSDRELKAKRLANAWSVWTTPSNRYWRRFKQGDENAIFEFAREAKGAILAPWVIAARYRWQLQGTVESKRKIRRAVSRWLDSRGRQRQEELFAQIRRDKAIAIAVLELRQKAEKVETAIEEVSRKKHLPEETIREIHRVYAAFGKQQFDSVSRALRYFRETDPSSVWDRSISIWDDEGTAFFLMEEILRMKAFGQIRLDDLRYTPPHPSRVIERFMRHIQPGHP